MHNLLAWEGFSRRKVKHGFFRAIPHAILWMLWIERKKRVFDEVETSLLRLKDKRLKTLFVREEAFCSSSFDFVDFVDSLFFGL